jgi:hypothetical protein
VWQISRTTHNQTNRLPILPDYCTVSLRSLSMRHAFI